MTIRRGLSLVVSPGESILSEAAGSQGLYLQTLPEDVGPTKDLLLPSTLLLSM